MKQSQIDKYVEGGRLTGDWQEPRKDGPHGGIDIGPPQPSQTGVEVRAGIEEGTVTFVGGNYGTVTIETSDGYEIKYLHFNEIFVKEGDKINSDTVLGEMGGMGPKGPNQFNIHVHIQVRDPSGNLIDPKEYFFGDKSAVDYNCPDNWNPSPTNKKREGLKG